MLRTQPAEGKSAFFPDCFYFCVQSRFEQELLADIQSAYGEQGATCTARNFTKNKKCDLLFICFSFCAAQEESRHLQALQILHKV